MSKTLAGALLGAVLAFAGLTYGFGGFVLVALLMLLGAVAGHFLSRSSMLCARVRHLGKSSS